MLGLFGVAGFLAFNFIAFNYYTAKSVEVQTHYDKAKRELEMAEMFRASGQQVLSDMEWLKQKESAPIANQDVQVELQAFCNQQAQQVGLTIIKQALLPSDTTAGRNYHRAKVQISFQGTEMALYSWLCQINAPDKLRSATHIVLTPNSEDDTRIDGSVTIEQWFIPLSPSA
jgi:hypothetical protein